LATTAGLAEESAPDKPAISEPKPAQPPKDGEKKPDEQKPPAPPKATTPGARRLNELFDLSLEQVLNIPVRTLGTLAPTTQRKAPVSATIITAEDIRLTPHRNVLDLIEVYVPGAMVFPHSEGRQLGIRGIISDRNLKFLVLVNGRQMNDKAHGGAYTELTNWDLNDIERIEVIRGPGSVTYGPGAISGVINLITKTAEQVQRPELTLQYMFPYDSKLGAISYGFKKKDIELFLHFSTTATAGQQHPRTFNMEGSLADGFGFIGTDDFRAGSPKSFPPHPFYSDFEDQPQYKAHVDLKFFQEWRFWSRFTTSGGNMDQRLALTRFQKGLDADGDPLFGKPEVSSEIQNRQLTLQLENTHEFSDTFNLDTALSWSYQDFERRRRTQNTFPSDAPSEIQQRVGDRNSVWNMQSNFGEDELLARVMAHLKPHSKIHASLGAEWALDHFGPKFGEGSDRLRMGDNFNYVSRPSSAAFDFSGLPQDLGGTKPANAFFVGDGWSTHTFSLLGELSLEFLPQFNVLLSGRVDKHRDTQYLFSPRVAILSEINDKNFLKASWQQSVRMTTAEQLLLSHQMGETAKTEDLTAVELNYDYQPLKRLHLSSSAYYNELNAVGFVVSSVSLGPGGATSFGGTIPQGVDKHMGLEFEARYSAKPFDFGLNHSYVKLLDFHLAPGVSSSSISYADYAELPDPVTGQPRLTGTGRDINSWSNHATKLFLNYRFLGDFTLHLDSRVFWGFPGAEDEIPMIEKAVRGTADDTPLLRRAIRDLEDRNVFGLNLRTNMSLTYDFKKNFSASLYGMNLLGVGDNKRLQHEIGTRTLVPRAFYTEEPRTFGIQCKLRF
jgi:outer membrane receptor protein involved in Fe transport